MKAKVPCQVYPVAWECNNRSRAEPQTCCCYHKLHAVLGGDPTNTLHTAVAISEEPETVTPAVNSEKEEEQEEEGETSFGALARPRTRTLSETPSRSSHSCQLSTGKLNAEERTSVMLSSRPTFNHEDPLPDLCCSPLPPPGYSSVLDSIFLQSADDDTTNTLTSPGHWLHRKQKFELEYV
ncbi:hypothetical protein UY3_15704 [Chelonia mydas]|uniref:Uncharacterized protein n=1 Tax=Chelonia mydas TaxID=8469 RepID=M7ARF0_CHEMY|nr:hypothetical protein UY3_15704 [Chelonia mydas]